MEDDGVLGAGEGLVEGLGIAQVPHGDPDVGEEIHAVSLATERGHLPALGDETLDQMTADEPCCSSDDGVRGHVRFLPY